MKKAHKKRKYTVKTKSRMFVIFLLFGAVISTLGYHLFTNLCQINKMQKEYENQNRGIEIIKVNDGYQMTTKKGAYECLVQLFDNRAKPSLSSAALEILSIIAYNPKITRAEIEAIRGVNSDGTLYRLLEYHLVEEAGKMDAPGRPTMYRTTDEFLKMFGISSLDELPELPRYRLDENEQIVLEEMSDVATNKSSEN